MSTPKTTGPDPRYDETRVVRAPRGPERTCKSWQTEAAYRMIQNNLDPEVAENPEGPGRLRRHRPRRAQLGVRSTRSSPRSGRSTTTRRCSCSRASRSASSRRIPTRRAC